MDEQIEYVDKVLSALPWRCFHCDFITSDAKEAAAHFGDRDDAEEFKPLCKWWNRISNGERIDEMQKLLADLELERRDNMGLRHQVEGLEYQVGSNTEAIKAYKPFRHAKCCTLNDVFNEYHSIEGRMLSAEEKLRAASIPRQERQNKVAKWVVEAFGEEQANSIPHRGVRFFEESTETVQSAGVSVEMAHKIVDYVFSRPVGMLWQELGGTGITLLALAEAAGYDADIEENRELERVLSKSIDHFKNRNKEKNDAGLIAV